MQCNIIKSFPLQLVSYTHIIYICMYVCMSVWVYNWAGSKVVWTKNIKYHKRCHYQWIIANYKLHSYYMLNHKKFCLILFLLIILVYIFKIMFIYIYIYIFFFSDKFKINILSTLSFNLSPWIKILVVSSQKKKKNS